MRYQAVEWIHEHADEPVVLYSEIDADDWERRKVEEYRDGHLDVAGFGLESGSTGLGELRIPSLAEIDAQDEFRARSISEREFESVWTRALDRLGLRG